MSIAEIRAGLDGVGQLTAQARGHAQLAAERLEEAARILAELGERSGTALPAEPVGRAREDVDAVVAALQAAGEVVGDLGARL